MGSRAVLLVCADAAAATRRFGSSSGETGAVYTRTGRSFFAPALTETLLERVRTAVGAAGLWSELDTDWVLLDAEILPWSAKAAGLLHDQYAAVGAAARAVFPPALAGLHSAGERGVDVTELLDRTAARAGNADAFTAAYRRYCWDVDGLDGVQVAPFQLLASVGAVHHERDHGWHLGIADRLVAADPGLFRSTRRQLVELGSPESTEAATQWWTELTRAGGEGMVVKPYAGYVRTGRVPVQPGLKVRGAEYLRIIYGPDYLEPDNLVRLKRRTWAPSVDWRSASTSLGWRPWAAWPTVTRCGGCTKRCSVSSPWSPSRSTPGCDAPPSQFSWARRGRRPRHY